MALVYKVTRANAPALHVHAGDVCVDVQDVCETSRVVEVVLQRPEFEGTSCLVTNRSSAASRTSVAVKPLGVILPSGSVAAQRFLFVEGAWKRWWPPERARGVNSSVEDAVAPNSTEHPEP